MNKGIINAILAIAIVMVILPVCTQAQPIPTPHGIAGIVYMSDGVTQAPLGTSFSVNDTTSGDFIAGTTGAGPDSGGYSVTIDGDDGDTVIVTAWDATHYGETTVALAGDMTGIDVVIDMPSGADTTPPAGVSNLDETDKGKTWIEWGWTNPSDPDFNHTEVYVNGVKADVNAPGNSYNATGLSPDTTYEVGTRTVDDSDNVNTEWVNDTATTSSEADTTPPASVSDLDEIGKGATWIQWDWTNPPDPDFNHTEVYLDGVFKADVYAPDHSYNATGIGSGTTYEIGTKTVDDSGGINATWVKDTATTLAAGPSAMRVNVMPEYYTFIGTSNIIWGNCHWDPADTIHTGTYNWTFDDGTSATGAVSDTAGWGHARYIPVTHTYTGEGVYYATLTVTADFDGLSDSDTVKINVYNASTLTAEQLEDVEVNKAIEDGLRCLYNRQYTDGKWDACGGYYIAGTGKAVLAFENHGYLPSKDINEDIYAEYVQIGLDYLFGHLSVQTLSDQAYIGNPDTNGNGIGLYWHDSGKHGDRPPYSVPIAMISIIGSLTPDVTATTGDATYVNGRTYRDITRDVCDYIAWAQNEAGGGVYRGGWRYSPNCGDSDNSVSQWPALGLLEAEKRWSITAPVYELVKGELELWADNSQNADGGFSYGSSGSSKIAMTGAGLIMLNYIGADTTDPRVISATTYLNNTWDINNADPGWRIKPYGTGSFYAMYGVYKGCLETEPSPIVYLPLPDGTRDWYADFVDYLLNTQTADGCWPAGAAHGDVDLDTMWAILILSPAVIGGPVADAGYDQYVSVHESVTFDGSGSYHTAGLTLTEYLWDFDTSDGVNWNNPDASGKTARYSTGYPAPGDYTVTLRVKDELGNTDTDTAVVNAAAKPPRYTLPPTDVPSTTPLGAAILIGSLSLLAVGRIKRRFN